MKFWAITLIFLFNFSLYAQTAKDSLAISSQEKKHSVLLATLFSTGLPGAGQVYNSIAMPKGKKHAYWKVPLIYAGLGASIYFLVKNQQKVNLYRDEYVNRVRFGVTSPDLAMYDLSAIKSLHDTYLNRRDLTILATFGVYVINILDAAVEAHFVKFDVSKNLSLQIRPTVIGGFTYATGVAVSLNFR
jgi:hypothetical protein